MTKERKLAIQMWQGIKDMITNNLNFSSRDLVNYKNEFCTKHNLDWLSNCWFCQYIPSCALCPLRNCTVYKVVCTVCIFNVNKEKRLKACDIIIAALEGRCAVK